jgi:hypothetical protein
MKNKFSSQCILGKVNDLTLETLIQLLDFRLVANSTIIPKVG